MNWGSKNFQPPRILQCNTLQNVRLHEMVTYSKPTHQDYITAYQQVSYAYRHGNFEVNAIYLVRESL